MKKNFNVTGAERKEMAQVVGKAIGIEPVYMRMPTCAYAVNNIIITRNGELVWDERTEDAVIQKVTEALHRAGYTEEEPLELQAEAETSEAETETEEEERPVEPVLLTVHIPAGRHNGNTLRNLINLVYTRGELINKALGTSLSAEKGLVDHLTEIESLHTAEAFRKAVNAYEEEHGPSLFGIKVTPDEIRFSSLPETSDPDQLKAFTELAAMMNKQALEQKRIQAKRTNEENEKYAFRIWLIRLGMKGDEYKETRKILLQNLNGHTAFRTEEEMERVKEKMRQKRDELRAAKAAADSAVS